jgi:ribonuclease HI
MTVPAMEIVAVIEALRTIPAGSEVTVATQSDYIRLSGAALVTRGAEGYRKWYGQYCEGRTTNYDLWRELDREVGLRSVEFVTATGADNRLCKKIAVGSL